MKNYEKYSKEYEEAQAVYTAITMKKIPHTQTAYADLPHNEQVAYQAAAAIKRYCDNPERYANNAYMIPQWYQEMKNAK